MNSLNIYKVSYILDSQESESFLIDGKNPGEAADKLVRVLIDTGIKVPSTIMVKVKKVEYNGHDYVEVKEEEI